MARFDVNNALQTLVAGLVGQQQAKQRAQQTKQQELRNSLMKAQTERLQRPEPTPRPRAGQIRTGPNGALILVNPDTATSQPVLDQAGQPVIIPPNRTAQFGGVWWETDESGQPVTPLVIGGGSTMEETVGGALKSSTTTSRGVTQTPGQPAFISETTQKNIPESVSEKFGFSPQGVPTKETATQVGGRTTTTIGPDPTREQLPPSRQEIIAIANKSNKRVVSLDSAGNIAINKTTLDSLSRQALEKGFKDNFNQIAPFKGESEQQTKIRAPIFARIALEYARALQRQGVDMSTSIAELEKMVGEGKSMQQLLQEAEGEDVEFEGQSAPVAPAPVAPAQTGPPQTFGHDTQALNRMIGTDVPDRAVIVGLEAIASGTIDAETAGAFLEWVSRSRPNAAKSPVYQRAINKRYPILPF